MYNPAAVIDRGYSCTRLKTVLMRSQMCSLIE